MSLNNPEAVIILNRIPVILDLMKEALSKVLKKTLPKVVQKETLEIEIPPLASLIDGFLDEVRRLQQFLPARKRNPFKFWNIVKDVDKRKCKLGLVASLDELYKMAQRIPPGPLTRLGNNQVEPPLSEDEQKLVTELVKVIEVIPNVLPDKVEIYSSIISRVSSDVGEKLDKILPRLPGSNDEKFVIATVRFLEFYWQHRTWRDWYENTVIALWNLAQELNHEPYEQKIEPLLYGKPYLSKSVFENGRI